MLARHVACTLLIVSWSSVACAADWHWPLDDNTSNAIHVTGHVSHADGVSNQCAVLDGAAVIRLKDSSEMVSGSAGFTLTAWVNPYLLNGQQQMIAARNCYSLNQRHWGVMIDRDNRFRFYVWQNKWVTVDTKTVPAVGHWHHIGVTVRPESAEFWLNGQRAGKVKLSVQVPHTNTPVTLGAVDDNGRVWQNFAGAIDDVRLFDEPLFAETLSAMYQPVAATHDVPSFAHLMDVTPNPSWDQQIEVHAQQDRQTLIFDGQNPDKLACDTTLRKMPDGSWVMIMLGGGHTEPLPQNRVFLSRSVDQGQTWSAMEPIDPGIKSANPNAALVPSELMVHGNRCTLFVATHDGTFANWKEWMTFSDDSCRTWSELQPVPGRLQERTFIRNHIVTGDGRILLPFQHYLRVAATKAISNGRRFSAPTNPRNGVLMSKDGGTTWTEHGDIRISNDDNYHGWAENNIVELSGGRIAMIIRADRLGGCLYVAESTDGGRTWPKFAAKTSVPNPGSKATLYSLGGDNVALLHNPNPRHRSPLALWVSFDGMRSWPYQRILVPQSIDGPSGRLNYPDGFVSEDRRWLSFAFDDNRHRAVGIKARLPTVSDNTMLWDKAATLPTTTAARVLENVQFHVIKRWEPQNDGYHWLHGVALAWHQDKLYASFGHNTGAENTLTEEARYCVSEDGGQSWSEPKTIDAGTEADDLAVSHGVFLSHQHQLWAFLGAFHNTRQQVHTRAYLLNSATGIWKAHGTVIADGFWPMAEPVKLQNGNWIMPGLIVGHGNPAAVAISAGDDVTAWKLFKIPSRNDVGKMWGESSLVVDDARIINIARYGQQPQALMSISEDFGQTWTASAPANLPMATSKPYSGVLSNGQKFLVGTTTADSGARRSPLTIAVSRPGENRFCRVYVIRHAEFSDGPGESSTKCQLSYPYAVEHAGKLYVGYSNSGPRSQNQNSAELAIIPIEQLQVR